MSYSKEVGGFIGRL